MRIQLASGFTKLYDDGECRIYEHKSRWRRTPYYVTPFNILTKSAFGQTSILWKGKKNFTDTLAMLDALEK